MANLTPTPNLNIPSPQAPDYYLKVSVDETGLPTSVYTVRLSPSSLPPIVIPNPIGLYDDHGQVLQQFEVLIQPPQVLVTASHGPNGVVKRVVSESSNLFIDSGNIFQRVTIPGLSFVPLNIPFDPTTPDLTVSGPAISYTNLDGFVGLKVELGPGRFRYANNNGQPAFYLNFPSIVVSYNNTAIQAYSFDQVVVPIYNP